MMFFVGAVVGVVVVVVVVAATFDAADLGETPRGRR